MNIATDPWIPIVWEGGKPGMVSLSEVYEGGHGVQDLAVRPHERVALMRLFLCVAQAALDGPADYDGWKICASSILPSTLGYLKKWHHAFELFGNGQRFLQLGKLKKPSNTSSIPNNEGNSISKLDIALATGNNSTLFDNAGGTERIFTPAQLALMLLTYQCFSPGGTIGVATWNGKPTPGWISYPKAAPGQSNHAPCLPGSMLHAFLRGANLADTVHLNLLNKHVVELALGVDTWGRPVWEAMPASPHDKLQITNATTTYLGRLVPLSRAVRLEDDGRCLLLANALTYPSYPEAREPSATVVIRKRDGAPIRATLGGSLDRAPWRELHSLTVKRIGLETNGGPLALQNLSDDRPFDLWVGGLVADQAKPLDTLESVFHVPAAMLTEPSQRAYEQGVALAETTEFRLRWAVSAYRRERGDNLDRPELRERRRRVQNQATEQYWTEVERDVNDLLAVAGNPALLGLDGAWQRTDWGRAIWRAALAAYDHASPHETARQIRAYALGRQALAATPAIQRSREETEL